MLTMKTESLAATAKMSAHETTPGHSFSTSDLMASITSNPLTEFALGNAVFSPVKFAVLSSKMDASHPYQKKKKKINILLSCEDLTNQKGSSKY